MARDFLGGAGFGIKLLYDELKPGIDPLGADNKLIFANGPLTGTSVPCASRIAVAAKSPLTNAMGVALSGGHFPAELRKAGFDVVIIEGIAKKPTYIWINNGKVELKDASKLWGTQTTDCQLFIKEQLGDHNARIACIGPAGEKLGRMACIINERRAAGRKGLGAVMGSKNLKAIAVRGDHEVNIADIQKFTESRKRMLTYMKESPVLYPEFSKRGTSMAVDVTSALGILPAKNWSKTGDFAPMDKIGSDAHEKFNVRREACYKCPVKCSQVRAVRQGRYAGYLSEGPEFETTYAFGGQTGNDDLASIVAADRICDELGLDTISTGVTIGFAMELYERGILSLEDTNGLELNFGNHKAMIDLIRMIAFREGIGDILAEGSRLAAERIGQEADKFAMHIKGLELPGYDVRGAKAHGLNYATSYTGADHNRGYAFQEIFGVPIPEEVDRFSAEGKGEITKWNQDVRTATCDCATLCAFLLDTALPAVATQNTADLVSAITSIDISAEEVQRVGERVNNLARAFNIREGLTRKDDTFPERLMSEKIPAGASKGNVITKEELQEMLDDYYQKRGWSQEGIPTVEKLKQLRLDYVVEDLKQLINNNAG